MQWLSRQHSERKWLANCVGCFRVQSLRFLRSRGRLLGKTAPMGNGTSTNIDSSANTIRLQMDVVSPARHLSQTVAQLALTEPTIYYSCLAYSARVMWIQGRIDKKLEEKYHATAITLLIQLLSSDLSPSGSIDALMASTVILRMSEQFYEIGNDGQFHLSSAFSVFVRPGISWSVFRTDLQGTTFWLHVRQNIRASFLQEKQLMYDMSYIEDEITFEPATDEVWTNRMTLILARLCNACWGPHDPDTQDQTILVLESCLDEWKARLPSSFNPWCTFKKEGEAFSTIRYLQPWHSKCKSFQSKPHTVKLTMFTYYAAIAQHFYYVARVMLAVFHPHRPKEQDVFLWVQYINVKCTLEWFNNVTDQCSIKFLPLLDSSVQYVYRTQIPRRSSMGYACLHGVQGSLSIRRNDRRHCSFCRSSWSEPSGQTRHVYTDSNRRGILSTVLFSMASGGLHE